MSSDHDAQNDEMLALESIYDSDEFSFKKDDSEISGQFHAFVSLPSQVKIEYQFLSTYKKKVQLSQDKASVSAGSKGPVNQIFVKYLPPIEFSFTLPPDYPSTSPPRFTLICSWLGRKQLSKLCEKLDSLWDENRGLEILFLWLSFLKEESFSFLELDSTINLSKQYSYNLIQLEREKMLRRKSEGKDAEAGPSGSGPSSSLVESSKSAEKQEQGSKTLVATSQGSPTKGRGRGRGRHFHRPPQPPLPESSAMNSAVQPSRDGEGSRKPFHPKRGHHKESKPTLRYELDPRAVSCDTLQTSLIGHILEYNRIRCEKEFQRNIYSCQICFEDKPGSQCIEFCGCGHIFCRECVGGYFEVQIKEGNVRGLICPEKGCKSEALQSQILGLVSPELFSRYDELLLSSALDEMEDIVYCPRKTCQYPVTYEKGETMARCAHCSYTFCTLCRMTYHGVERCRIKIDSGLVAEYKSASKERKEFLERKYGRRTLQEMLETGYSEQWIRGNSKSCPHCQAAIEKSDGCNKMTCWKCNTFFCWICMTRLNPSSPYNHFNSPTSPCFNLLFHGVVESGSDDDDIFLDFQESDSEGEDYFGYVP
ncbi:hypothetical protein ONE63_004675 [Megalurothrips usitatus]|uniref:RBR-type E3 ubiquitin transferase n=1 Tax=Megalurothrips usitatus TaxID=439358 RepID=A0AAV7X4N6_9NEOP|nr:hypothetical protein ONE63_004675 [Megalurothrips usitatus]